MQLRDRSYIFKAESRAGVRFLADHHGSHQGNLTTRRAFKSEKAEESKLTAGVFEPEQRTVMEVGCRGDVLRA